MIFRLSTSDFLPGDWKIIHTNSEDFLPGAWEEAAELDSNLSRIYDETTGKTWHDYNIDLSQPSIDGISKEVLVGFRIRIKLIGRILAQLFIQPLLSIVNVVLRALKLITFFHFWKERNEEEYNFTARLLDAGNDCLKIILSVTLISLISVELALFYGLYSPNDGIKFHNTLEIAIYGCPISSDNFYKDMEGWGQKEDAGLCDFFKKWLQL